MRSYGVVKKLKSKILYEYVLKSSKVHQCGGHEGRK